MSLCSFFLLYVSPAGGLSYLHSLRLNNKTTHKGRTTKGGKEDNPHGKEERQRRKGDHRLEQVKREEEFDLMQVACMPRIRPREKSGHGQRHGRS